MTKAIYHSEVIFNLNSRLFLNALAGITERTAKERISDHNNPLNWLAVHTVWARYNIAALMGSRAIILIKAYSKVSNHLTRITNMTHLLKQRPNGKKAPNC